jgi:hypothetical protein
MSALILTCYSAYNDSALKAIIKQFGVSRVCVWHPPSLQSHQRAFASKRNYLHDVYRDLETRVQNIKPAVIVTRDISTIHNDNVYAFQQLVYDLDNTLIQTFRSRIKMLKPL